MVEMLPLLPVFVILFGLAFGLWTSIHSGILQSIAARYYAFEVINNRTHFIYHRDTEPPTDKKQYYEKNGKRFFAVIKLQTTGDPRLTAETQKLNLFDSNILQITGEPSNTNQQRNPIKLKTGYGICIDFDCGD